MRVAVVSLFPEIIQNYFNYGIAGRSLKNHLVEVCYYNLRDYAHSKHNTVDDRPFGGGAGMVLKPEPVGLAIDAAKKAFLVAGIVEQPIVIYLSPHGEILKQKTVRRYASLLQPLIFLAGRYEGVDQRVIDKYVDVEYSIGDYILSGGELAILAMLDAIIRLLPGALGDAQSVVDESFSDNLNGLLEYPHYTRPTDYYGLKVPSVLQTGNHKKINEWRQKQAIGRTWLRRPDLLEYISLTSEQKRLLIDFKKELLE